MKNVRLETIILEILEELEIMDYSKENRLSYTERAQPSRGFLNPGRKGLLNERFHDVRGSKGSHQEENKGTL